MTTATATPDSILFATVSITADSVLYGEVGLITGENADGTFSVELNGFDAIDLYDHEFRII